MNKYASMPIEPAQLDWRLDEQGHSVPISRQFGDVYFSLQDGLAETRYVFLQQNRLPERFLRCLSESSDLSVRPFTVLELGFGTGLNFLATWQLWRSVRQDWAKNGAKKDPIRPSARLHFISTEKFPLNRSDLDRALKSWAVAYPDLAGLIDRLLAAYPPLIAGCHRLHFFEDNLTLDLWLGDAKDSLQKLDSSHGARVDAWFLDGFAPKCNADLWAEAIFLQMQRLSCYGTTVATFSSAGVVKRGLQAVGFCVSKVKGFGKKREMICAEFASDSAISDMSDNTQYDPQNNLHKKPSARSIVSAIPDANLPIVIVGAGVCGLMMAWSLAQRGVACRLLDQTAPLAGASGNPRGLLAPKLTALSHVEEHLHTIGYLYSTRLYQQMNDWANAGQYFQNTHTFAQNFDDGDHDNGDHRAEKNFTADRPAPIFERTGALDLMVQTHMTCAKIAQYPSEIAQVLDDRDAQDRTGLTQDLSRNHFLPQAGLINPQALADHVLAHPLIDFSVFDVAKLHPTDGTVILTQADGQTITAKKAILCAGYASCDLDGRLFQCRAIRGQLSWYPIASDAPNLPKIPLKYGGYCASFVGGSAENPQNAIQPDQRYFLLGASFMRNDTDLTPRSAEDWQNREKLLAATPDLASTIATPDATWSARVGIRAQTPDYYPLVGSPDGRIDPAVPVWVLYGMGSKGYTMAPVCAEILADRLTGQFAPVSQRLLAQIDPNRPRLKTPLDLKS